MKNDIPILRTQNLEKEFAGKRVVDNVNMEVWPGEIVALIGENGAGKTTIKNMLVGLLPPTHGTVTFEGTETERVRMGEFDTAAVHQELSMFPSLSVAENVCLTDMPGLKPFVSWRDCKTSAKEYLDMVDADLDLDIPVEFLGPGERQLVEIAKALRQKPRLLILDEPTTSLTSPERARLFDVMRNLKKSGIGIVFITHFINEVYEVCDKIVVLRNGMHVGGGLVEEVGRKKVEELMVGHSIEERSINIGTPSEEVAFSIRDFDSDRFIGIDFEVKHGEILGIAGLMGAGRTELIESIFGLRKTRGSIVVDGIVYRNWNPTMMKNLGILFIPEDRRTSGIFPTRDVKENISIAALERFLKRLIPGLGFRGEKKGVQAVVSELRIRCYDLDDPIMSLSGGNQQKTIVGRWLAIRPKICMFDDPTRGVDIGAKDEISKLIAQLARQGNAVILVSSDINELMLLSHRMIIMRKGKFVAELDRSQFDAKEIIAIAATSD